MDRYILQAKTGKVIAPKTVHVVRHGQSLHNAQALACNGVDANDAAYIDSPLTPLGEAQACDIRMRVKSMNPDLIVSSPMTRATQTAILATATLSPDVPFVITPLCTERLAYSCDIGSPVSILRQRFPKLDYSACVPYDAWWWTACADDKSQAGTLKMLRHYPPGSYMNVEPTSSVAARANRFRLWLLERPEKNIVVFAHGAFLVMLLDASERFANCEIRKLTL